MIKTLVEEVNLVLIFKIFIKVPVARNYKLNIPFFFISFIFGLYLCNIYLRSLSFCCIFFELAIMNCKVWPVICYILQRPYHTVNTPQNTMNEKLFYAMNPLRLVCNIIVCQYDNSNFSQT